MSFETEEDLESKKRVNEIIAFYDREAHKVIHSFIDIHGLDGEYVVTDFSVTCISSFLMEYDNHHAQLPDGVWPKVIKMYMRLIEIDFDFLEKVHAYICRKH